MVKPAMRIVRRVSGMEDLHRTESTVGEVLPIHAQRYPSFGQHVGRFSVSEKAHTQGFNAAAALLQPHYLRLRVPLAIITGSMDAIVDSRDHSCRLHQHAPESTLTIVPGGGHMIHYSAPTQIGRAVDGLTGPQTKPRRSADWLGR
jgi:pimeloyl-ACP methyl ester carboxylesterase